MNDINSVLYTIEWGQKLSSAFFSNFLRCLPLYTFKHLRTFSIHQHKALNVILYVECAPPDMNTVAKKKFFIHSRCYEAAETLFEAEFRRDYAYIQPHLKSEREDNFDWLRE